MTQKMRSRADLEHDLEVDAIRIRMLEQEIESLSKKYRVRGNLIEDLGAQLLEARRDRDRFKADHLNACQTIAAMYAAATGVEGRAPIRGVVEDVEDVRAEYLRVCSEKQHWVDVASQEFMLRDRADAATAEQIRRSEALQLRVIDLKSELRKADEVNGELLVQVADFWDGPAFPNGITMISKGVGYRLTHRYDDPRDLYRLSDNFQVGMVDQNPSKGGTVTVQVKLDTEEFEAKLTELAASVERATKPLYILWSDPSTW